MLASSVGRAPASAEANPELTFNSDHQITADQTKHLGASTVAEQLSSKPLRDPVPRIAHHIARTKFDDIAPEALASAKTFLLDTVGVGLAGTADPNVGRIIAAAAAWGESHDATIWNSRLRLPAPSAAFANAYLIHCLEFDCIHEAAVVHPMATLVSALLAWCERASRGGDPVSGRRFLTALVVGVDVASLLGVSTRSPLRFFRPATAGGFGALAAIANVAGFDEEQVRDALGIQYGQTSGTMQAHVEGSMALGLQIGFNARAAITAADLAAARLRGPHNVLTGPFGYFALFENGSYDSSAIDAELGRRWQITQLSHKPYPSGRLSHGSVDGLARLMRKHGFSAEDIEEVTVRAPSLVMRLVGRPDVPNPTSNYAKLCIPFVAGTFLARGRVDVPDFASPDMLNDPRVHSFAARIRVVQDENPDENAIAPQRIAVRLKGGATHEALLPVIYGHPDAPLTPAENLNKFARCCSYAQPPVPASARDQLIDVISRLETAEDVAPVAALVSLPVEDGQVLGTDPD